MMFKVLAFLSKKPGISHLEFRNYYEQHHVPLVGEVAPPMRAYRRNFLNFNDAANLCDNQLDFDVVTEMEFADRNEFDVWARAFFADGTKEKVAADEEKFIDRTRVRCCVVEPCATHPGT